MHPAVLCSSLERDSPMIPSHCCSVRFSAQRISEQYANGVCFTHLNSIEENYESLDTFLQSWYTRLPRNFLEKSESILETDEGKRLRSRRRLELRQGGVKSFAHGGDSSVDNPAESLRLMFIDDGRYHKGSAA